MIDKKVGFWLIGGLILIVFFVVLFVGCSVEKKVPQEGTMGVAPNEQVVQVVSTEAKVVESETSEVIKNEGYSVNEDILKDSKDSKLEAEEKMLVPVGDVSVVNRYVSDVLVSGKNMYLLDDTIYAYSLKMVLPVEDEGLQVVDYMCSVATWNSVESGESITVEYGVDSNGKIVVLSLSK